MTHRRIDSPEEAMEVAFEQILELRRRLDRPQTRVRIGRYTITTDANGDLIARHIDGTVTVLASP